MTCPTRSADILNAQSPKEIIDAIMRHRRECRYCTRVKAEGCSEPIGNKSAKAA